MRLCLNPYKTNQQNSIHKQKVVCDHNDFLTLFLMVPVLNSDFLRICLIKTVSKHSLWIGTFLYQLRAFWSKFQVHTSFFKDMVRFVKLPTDGTLNLPLFLISSWQLIESLFKCLFGAQQFIAQSNIFFFKFCDLWTALA